MHFHEMLRKFWADEQTEKSALRRNTSEVETSRDGGRRERGEWREDSRKCCQE